jgi:nitrogen-specific signal transduction histidine kinase/CheY-like chemotaxis protein
MAQKEREELEQRLQQAHKMEAIGTLAGGIAHDFNNILTAIVGFTEVGLLHSNPDTPDHERFEEILKAANRAADLVRQILTFSRQQSQERKPVQLSVIVKEVIKFIRATLPTSIDIRPIFADDDSLILADATQIHQIILNLCTNAHHAMPAEGGRITVSLELETLDEDAFSDEPAFKPGAYVKLTVADTGFGMDADTLSRIFEPYFTTKEKGKGTGLGLAVVHGIVKSHGGIIQAQSELGIGTRFIIYLPRVYQKAQPKSAPPKPPKKGSEHITIIDDEPAILKIAEQLLAHLGYHISTFEDPLEAMDRIAAQQLQPDVVVTDLTMPGITGDQLAPKLKQIQPELPVILCTGYRESITLEKARELGIHSLLMKPFTMNSLTEAVKQALEDRLSTHPQ